MTDRSHSPRPARGVRGRTASVCLLLASRVIAADTSETPAANQEYSPGLEEIVVTAERREEKLDKVPISVTAFSQKTMDDLHIQSFNDLAAIVPGLVVSTPQSGVQGLSDVAIRGIFSGGNAPTTQFYIDETPVAIRRQDGAGPAGSPHPLIFDLDRVEVLRGPQGTLFGSSAMGGAIRYITPQPSLTDTSGYAKLDLGYTHDGGANYETGVAFGTPIVAGVAGLRVSGWFESEGGFIDREDPFTGEITEKKANSSKSYVIRPALTVVPLPGLSMTTSAFLQHVHQNEPDLYWLNFLPNRSTRADGSLVREPSTDDLRVASFAIKYELPAVTLQSDTSYLDREYEDFNDITQGLESEFSGGIPFLPGLAAFRSYEDDLSFTHAWQQEFRLTSASPDSRVSWVAGAYYRNAVTGLAQLIPPDLSPITQSIAGVNSQQYFGNPDFVVNGLVLNSYTNFQTTDVQEALFGEVTVAILPRVRVNAGVRIEHSVVEHQNEIVAGPLNGLAYSNTTLPDQVGNPVTPRFGVTYQYTDDDMVYATAAKGYRAGGGNAATSVGNALCDSSLAALGLTSVPKSFGPDTLWSYEIGAKDELFEKRLAIQASVYYINWTNIQTGVTLVSCNEGFTANRGKATSQGFDLQMAAIVAEGLKVSANVGYTDAYYPNAAYGAPINGVTPLLNGVGEKLANVVPWTASLHTDYSRAIGRIWSDARAYLRTDFRWLSAPNALNPQDNAFDPQVGPYQNQAYGTLDVRLGVLHEGFDLSAYVLNANHTDPRLGFGHAAGGDPLFTAAALRPLTAGFTAYYRF